MYNAPSDRLLHGPVRRCPLLQGRERHWWQQKVEIMRLHSLSVGLAMLAVATSAAARTGDKAAQGKVFAIDACSACHQVEPGQKPPPPVHDANTDEDVTAPSFMEIARDHGTNKDYLRRHIKDPAWPMRQQMFDDYYLEDIIAYIRSLDPGRAKPTIRHKAAGLPPRPISPARG
jgi:mono/diheme cytochrome c family protein